MIKAKRELQDLREVMMEEVEIALRVNGVNYRVKTVPWRTLVEVLREALGLVGTKNLVTRGSVAPAR